MNYLTPEEEAEGRAESERMYRTQLWKIGAIIVIGLAVWAAHGFPGLLP